MVRPVLALLVYTNFALAVAANPLGVWQSLLAAGPASEQKDATAASGLPVGDSPPAPASAVAQSGDTKTQTPTPKPLPADLPKTSTTKGSMRVRAVDFAGQPLPAAKIHVSVWTDEKEFKANQDYVCDEQGHVEVKLPESLEILRVWAAKDHYVPLFANWGSKRPVEDVIPEEFTFQLPKGTVMGGIVQDEDGQPVEGAKVEVEYEKGGHADGVGKRPGFDRWLCEGSDALTTDAQGRWTLDNVPPGDEVQVQVKVVHPDFISFRSSYDIGLEKPLSTKDLRAKTAIKVLKRGVSVTGTITDPDGKPVPNALMIWGDRPYWEHRPQQEVHTDEQGVYRFPPLPLVSMRVTVVAPGFAPDLRKVDIRPDIAPVDFQLKPGKTLRVKIVDAAGNAVPDVGVRIEKWRGGESLYNDKHSNVIDSTIPRKADADGIYEWTWAPDDPVSFTFGKKGFVRLQVDLTADGKEQTQVFPELLKISGHVTDAKTGRPIERFTALTVLDFSDNLRHVERTRGKTYLNGEFAMELDRTDTPYRVRVEADGYRVAMSGPYRAGQPSPPCDFQLEPAEPARGRILDADGHPVVGAKVYMVTKSQTLSLRQEEERSEDYDNQRVVTNEQGEFEFPAQFERYTIIATHDRGYSEARFPPDPSPGDMTLQKWASVEGRLFQAGKPVSDSAIYFFPIRPRFGDYCYIDDNLFGKTDDAGHFSFPRVPPIKFALKADLSPWRDYPITSSESVPLDIQPGQHVAVELGGRGAQVVGRVQLKGEAAKAIELNYALNYLLHLAPGIEPTAEVRPLGFDWRRGWNEAFSSTQEGGGYRETLHHYFVKLAQDGSFLVSGVPAGDYEFALKIYEKPEGCLVNPVAAKIVKFHVTEADVARQSLDLGTIEVDAALGPKAGEMVPDFEFETADGRRQRLSELRGQYLLVDFWATWCNSCVANLPAVRSLFDKYRPERRLLVLGVNVDADKDAARRFVQERSLSWAQGFLGEASSSAVLTRLGISSAPMYLLIAPDGTLVDKNYSVEAIGAKLQEVLRAAPPNAQSSDTLQAAIPIGTLVLAAPNAEPKDTAPTPKQPPETSPPPLSEEALSIARKVSRSFAENYKQLGPIKARLCWEVQSTPVITPAAASEGPPKDDPLARFVPRLQLVPQPPRTPLIVLWTADVAPDAARFDVDSPAGKQVFSMDKTGVTIYTPDAKRAMMMSPRMPARLQGQAQYDPREVGFLTLGERFEDIVPATVLSARRIDRAEGESVAEIRAYNPVQGCKMVIECSSRFGNLPTRTYCLSNEDLVTSVTDITYQQVRQGPAPAWFLKSAVTRISIAPKNKSPDDAEWDQTATLSVVELALDATPPPARQGRDDLPKGITVTEEIRTVSELH